MPDLDLRALPAELQAALHQAWPDCPEAQRRALLAPRCWSGWQPTWPGRVWAWEPRRRWLRPFRAREYREIAEALFVDHVGDVLRKHEPRLFDPAQPFFDTPWTQARVLLRSPEPAVFSDAEFWAIAQQLCGGDVAHATATAGDWAQGMRADGAVRGWRREGWLLNAVAVLESSAAGTFL
ncbi:hypothetical protein [Roseateles asaccharophilus]|uniref:Uncharacterized protein n=1 Tax=Roseateles asaccharophilus TaxID=582607 RepID=A0ABU2A8F4_9BURK|nr:hypothetical protein [Roseateles asaccharophilus]MDR7333415.1 hypothetical protein [Roseateles asaccharophilus]